jgi:hypothetical protein
MREKEGGIPYSRLVAVADTLLEESDDDSARLARGIGALEQPVRDELIVSDQLNAYQVFYYFFRTEPAILLRERLELEPASALLSGLTIEATDFLDMVFAIRDNRGVISISDGETIRATFSGRSAYAEGRLFLENPE